ncbi:MAG: flagellar basal body P-ring formation chaperone FlgA [Candidatus Kapaibacteriota bacterium]
MKCKKTFHILGLIFLFALVARSETYFSGDLIKERLYQEVRNRVGSDAEIILPRTISNYLFAEENVVMNFDFGNQVLSGNLFVGVEFWQNQKKLRRVEIPIRVKLIKEVLVATKTISRGEAISFENCIVEKREIPSSIEPDETNLESILGKEAKYFIVKGTILTKELVQEPFAIRRGEKVRIVVLFGKVQINTYGVALNDANVGESVRVRREGNNNILVGLASKDKCVIITK